MSNRHFIPRLPKKLSEQLLPANDDIAINSINVSIDALNDLIGLLPERYRWRFRTADAFTEELNELTAKEKNVQKLNDFYWKDTLRTCEAYSIMCTWRMGELAQSCIWALARNDINCSALTARAALEAAAQYVDTARTLSASLEKLEIESLRTHICISEDIERLLLKTVFGTRLEDQEEIYKTPNVLTILNRINKIEGQGFVLSTYNLLCEITHPNYLGRSIYILSTEPRSRPGDEVRTLSRGRGETTTPIIRASVRALSWACMTQVTAFLLVRDTIGELLAKLMGASK